MSEFNNTQYYADDQDALRAYIIQVFNKIGIAMIITAGVAWLGYQSLLSGGFASSVVENPVLLLILVIAQFGICIYLSARLQKMSVTTANVMLYVYAAITGATFSYLPAYFGVGTVFEAFAFAAVLFFSCAIIGHTTKVDLTKFSGLMVGGLIALVLASVVGMFFQSAAYNLMIAYIGIVLFLFLTAWDMQKIKSYYYSTGGYDDMKDKMAVFGAFQLYLDFINLFLYILRILGNSRNRN